MTRPSCYDVLHLVKEVVPEELEDVTLSRLRPFPACLVRPFVQRAELQEEPQQAPVVVLAFGVGVRV